MLKRILMIRTHFPGLDYPPAGVAPGYEPAVYS
jgi:hypothetical protein